MKKINPRKALYIKLGLGGVWERDCIQRDQTLRLGYVEASHEACLQRKWDIVTGEIEKIRDDPGAATRDVNQIRAFYESGEDVLWVTFFGDRLWWCFSKPQLTQLPDKTKIRPVIGQWNSSDVTGLPLQKNQLSGRLLSMQGFRGTICSVKEIEYMVQKINGDEPQNVKDVKEALVTLEQRLEAIVRSLHWKDFEVLVDLIFRQAGWQRVGQAGETQKTLDLDLLSPITSERYGIQIKSRASLADFKNYQQQFRDMQGYARFYFVVHTPSPDLEQSTKRDDFELLLLPDIARLATKYGLTDWIIAKAG
jgi:hypothetical protein